ncbi:MAG: hypothetical protein EPO52_17560 [Herbiconiux sp.]|uniref:hypothetical protein n=1 Tax=Herbiconiux sp. TaxID=1871186 RepID=UPI0011F9A9F8|nr:hypothetical protein [Herbiconiux sp.]TAJ46340.1 MAG: hypothetical protein EPO52_17560 [Herbiconiux sp.]
METTTDQKIEAVDLALAHIEDILTPLNLAAIQRAPLDTKFEFDWEAIARTGFTDTHLVTVARTMLMMTKHALAEDVADSTIVSSTKITGTHLAELINGSFPDCAGEAVGRAA